VHCECEGRDEDKNCGFGFGNHAVVACRFQVAVHLSDLATVTVTEEPRVQHLDTTLCPVQNSKYTKTIVNKQVGAVEKPTLPLDHINAHVL